MATSDENDAETVSFDESEIAQLSFPLETYQEAWEALKEERGPLRILICGKGGAGKSSLVNNLFELNGEDEADEGMAGSSTTMECGLYTRTTKFGDTIFVFDSPGFGDLKMSNEEIIAKMITATEKSVDVILYCISLNPGACRVEKEDKQALEIITQCFTSKIWKKAVIVLTFANMLQEKFSESVQNYSTIIDKVSGDIIGTLKEQPSAKASIIDDLPIETAGYKNPHLPLDPDKDWRDRLFITMLQQVLTEKIPSLFEVRYRLRDMIRTARKAGPKAGKGFAAGSTIGGLVGATLAEILGPIGPVVGAIGGGAIGSGLGAHKEIKFEVTKMKRILIIKFKKWQSKRRICA